MIVFALCWWEKGKGCLVTKADLKDAFRIIPISPLDYRLLGFKFKGQLYFDMCLPMGCSTSCQTFESLSQAVHWICVHKAKILHTSHILDDFIFSERPFHVVSYIWTGFMKYVV